MVRIRNFSILSFSAILFALAFPPVGMWIAAPISFAIFFRILSSTKIKVLSAFLFGSISGLLILSWSKTFVGVLPWLFLALLQGLFYLPVGFTARYSNKTYLLVAMLVVTEELRNRFPFGGFGWIRLAYSQVDSPFAKIVSVTGAVGLSVITLLVAAAISRPKAQSFGLIIASIALIQLININPNSSTEVKIRAVQGGVPERGLEFNARAQQVLDNHIATTLKDFTSEDDLILWPENAIDVDPERNAVARRKIKNLQERTQVPLLAGAILDREVLSNSAMKFARDASVESTYVKRYLTPFGEFIPLRNMASKLSPHTDRVTDFTRGTQFQRHSVGSVTVSSIICYEILSDSIVRESAKNSNILTVLTNSATFAGSSEGNQQLAITRLRAIETGRNIVSVSTTGPTAFINARGEVTQTLKDGETGSLTSAVGALSHQNFALRYGELINTLVILFSLLVLAGASWRGFRRS